MKRLTQRHTATATSPDPQTAFPPPQADKLPEQGTTARLELGTEQRNQPNEP